MWEMCVCVCVCNVCARNVMRYLCVWCVWCDDMWCEWCVMWMMCVIIYTHMFTHKSTNSTTHTHTHLFCRGCLPIRRLCLPSTHNRWIQWINVHFEPLLWLLLLLLWVLWWWWWWWWWVLCWLWAVVPCGDGLGEVCGCRSGLMKDKVLISKMNEEIYIYMLN